MNILVLSDLHMADNQHLGTFGWDPLHFIGKLEAVRKNHAVDQVVLNGDIFDLYKSNYNDIFHRNKELIEYLDDIGSVFIKGNHDHALEFGQEHFGIVNSKGEKIHIEHGHRGDFINGTSCGRLLGNLLYVFLKTVSHFSVTRKLYFWCMEHDEGFRGHGKYNSYKYLKYAVKLLHKYDMVVLGHTHKMEFHDTYWQSNKKRYINSGSCSFGRFQGIIIDTETLCHYTIKIDPYRSFVNSQNTSKRSTRPLKPSFVNNGRLVPV